MAGFTSYVFEIVPAIAVDRFFVVAMISYSHLTFFVQNIVLVTKRVYWNILLWVPLK
jgi:hypothetical protein